MFKNMNLRTKLLIAFLAIGIIPFAIIGSAIVAKTMESGIPLVAADRPARNANIVVLADNRQGGNMRQRCSEENSSEKIPSSFVVLVLSVQFSITWRDSSERVDRIAGKSCYTKRGPGSCKENNPGQFTFSGRNCVMKIYA